jgi:PAS domain S-box-containing protein
VRPEAGAFTQEQSSGQPHGLPVRSPVALGRGLGGQLLVRVLLFSSVVTLILTALQLYLDYRRDISILDRRLTEIERSYLPGITEGLWQLNERQIELQLEGILRLPDMNAVEVTEATERSNPLHLVAGTRQTHSIVARQIPIVHAVRGSDRVIGELYIEATLTGIYRALANKTLVILLSQGAKTFLVSLFILYILHYLVTRHLGTIAGAIENVDPRKQPAPLVLQRQRPSQADELDKVVGAFNNVHARLHEAYDDLRAANAELARDNAARQTAEIALRQSELRFRDYAETASDWFWESDAEHHLSYLSERISTFGIAVDLLLGRKRWEAATDLEEDPEKWDRHFAALERREAFRDFTYRIRLADGNDGYLSSSGKPVFDAAGRFLGYRGVGRDVTASVRAERALRVAKRQAELANKAKSDFLANMSHELRTPLNAIIGLSEMIESEILGPVGNVHYREYVSDINRSGQHLLGIINTILDLAKVEAGKLELQLSDLPLRDLVGEIVRIMTPQVEAAGLAIVTEIATDLPPVRADALAIRRILFNLISNALKFTPAGGKVTVTLRRVTDGARDQAIELSVADTGIGIAPEHLPLLMRPFVQLDDVYQRKFQGAGLGLALVRALVEPHGGTVTIASAPGEGTCVTIRLPASLATIVTES